MARDGARKAEPRDGGGTAPLSASRTVLVVTRDSARGGEIVGALQSRGAPSVQASTARQALFWARVSTPALVVLDMKVQGARLLLGEFRNEGRLLVALDDDADERTWALGAGCLDALPYSVEPDELALKLARLAVSHRAQPGGIVVAGPLTVDLSACRLVWKDQQLTVSPLLLALAAYLAARAGQLTPVRALLQDVWGEPWANPDRVHQAIYRLRRRLREPPDSPFLVAKRGHGYGLFPKAVRVEPHRSATSIPTKG